MTDTLYVAPEPSGASAEDGSDPKLQPAVQDATERIARLQAKAG